MSDSTIEPGGAPPPQPNTSSCRVLANASVLPGTPLYTASDGTVGPAMANSATTAQAIGIALFPASNGERVQYRYSGPLTLPAADWAAVLNTGSQLTPGATYYVSQATAGKITLTRPGSGIACAVGYAVSETTLLVGLNAQQAIGG